MTKNRWTALAASLAAMVYTVSAQAQTRGYGYGNDSWMASGLSPLIALLGLGLLLAMVGAMAAMAMRGGRGPRGRFDGA